MDVVSIHILGPFSISRDGQPLALSVGRKPRALLTYLLMTGGTSTREQLATLFWPDRFEAQARQSLRQAVSSLRKLLEDEGHMILSEEDRLSVNRDGLACDATAFEQAAMASDLESWHRAATLYVGDLLEGIGPVSEAFDLWLVGERERLRSLAADILWKIASAAEGDAGEAPGVRSPDRETRLAAAERLVRLDPYREDGQRALIRLYVDLGRRSAALSQFQTCRDVLERDLGVSPEAETQRLYEEIRGKGAAESDPPPSVTPGLQGSTGEGGTIESVRETEVPVAPESSAPSLSVPARLPPRRWRRAMIWGSALGALAVLALLGLGLQGWRDGGNDPSLAPPPTSSPDLSSGPPDAVESLAQLAGLEFKAGADHHAAAIPTIAVLPFEALPGPVSDSGVGPGLTVGITTALSMLEEMRVIASPPRNGRMGDQDWAKLARQWGARYILAGTVQQTEDRVRISATLIDSSRGTNLWAQSFDRARDDIFAVQDSIVQDILIALKVELTEGEQARIHASLRRPDLKAWLHANQALTHMRRLTREGNQRARALYQHAITLDPLYGGGWEGLAWTHLIDARFGWSRSRTESLHQAEEAAQRGMEAESPVGTDASLLSVLALMRGEHDKAVALGEQAMASRPGSGDVAALLALVLTYSGEIPRGISLSRRALRLSPVPSGWYWWILARGYRLQGRSEAACSILSRTTDPHNPSIAALVELAIACEIARRDEATRSAAQRLWEQAPSFDAEAWLQIPPYAVRSHLEADLKALRAALER